MTLKDKIAVTLQNTISQLGPVPDCHGSLIRNMLGGDVGSIIGLGICLELCLEEQSYRPFNDLSRQLERKEDVR